jgi:hypothetical protein
MHPTSTLSVRADRAAIYAEAARRRRKASLAKQKEAINLRALALVYELRKSGKSVKRSHEKALRG